MNGLRVISGKAKGLRIKSVPGDTTRPITDKVKEALFNIIGADIASGAGAVFLDLFAGTGAVGIEALSRGARFARFIDLNQKAVAVIRENLAHTRLNAAADVKKMDAFSLLKQSPDCTFDYVYIAPPQYQALWKQALQTLDQNVEWLTDDAWVIVQIHPVEYEPVELVNFSEFDRRDYGSTILVFYERV